MMNNPSSKNPRLKTTSEEFQPADKDKTCGAHEAASHSDKGSPLHPQMNQTDYGNVDVVNYNDELYEDNYNTIKNDPEEEPSSDYMNLPVQTSEIVLNPQSSSDTCNHPAPKHIRTHKQDSEPSGTKNKEIMDSRNKQQSNNLVPNCQTHPMASKPKQKPPKRSAETSIISAKLQPPAPPQASKPRPLRWQYKAKSFPLDSYYPFTGITGNKQPHPLQPIQSDLTFLVPQQLPSKTMSLPPQIPTQIPGARAMPPKLTPSRTGPVRPVPDTPGPPPSAHLPLQPPPKSMAAFSDSSNDKGNGNMADSPIYKSIKRKDVKLVKPIGQGGFGAVFKAIWNDQEVAAKRLIQLDRHEAEVLSDLDHPHIVKLLGVIEENFEFYLVLELCKGGSLRDYLNQHREKKTKLTLDQILDYAKQAAKAIEYLKEKKLIHKDVKSANYLIADGNLLKLADFGLAKNTDVTVTATERASHPWMAPELLRDGILSPSYDIHSYGIVIWELCTTEIPFADAHVPGQPNLIWRICNNNERPPIPPSCPKALADLMRRCWEANWHKRPSIQDILEMLILQNHTPTKTHNWLPEPSQSRDPIEASSSTPSTLTSSDSPTQTTHVSKPPLAGQPPPSKVPKRHQNSIVSIGQIFFRNSKN